MNTRIRMTISAVVYGVSISLWAGGAAAATVNTTANQIGRLTSVGNAGARIYHQYDADGRLVGSQHVQDGRSWVFTTEYGYPQNPSTTAGPGMVVIKEVFPDGEQLSYTHDATGEIVTIRSGSGAATEDVLRDRRTNSRGQITRIVLGNGAETTYGYDDAGTLRLTKLTTLSGAGVKLQEYTYAYDNNGNVTGTVDAVRPDQSFTLRYDTLGQVTAMLGPLGGVIESYGYDAIGNLTAKGALTQTYNAGGRPNALSQSGALTYDYDPNGNVTRVGGTTVAWSAENMASKVMTPTVISEKAFVGEALWKKNEKGVTTYYLPGVRVENGVLRKYYGTFAERVEQPGARQLRFYHPDHLGSSAVMTDHDGKVIRRASYFPWGQDRGVDGTFTPKLQFNFKEKDETGFYDYGARLYDPNSGRWLAPDTDLTDGLNRYAYVGNNPWTRIDPSGHFAQDPQQPQPIPDPNPYDPSCDCYPYDEVLTTVVNQKGDKPASTKVISRKYEEGYETDPYGWEARLGIRYVQGVTTTHLTKGLHSEVIRVRDDGTVLSVQHVQCARCAGGVQVMNNPFDPLGLPVTPSGLGKQVIRRGGQRLLFGSARGRVFWTNRLGKEADDFASSIGGHTINQTNFGKIMNFSEKFIDPKYTYYGWKWGSAPFASGVRGDVFYLRRAGEPLGNILQNTELPRFTIKADSVTPVIVPRQ